jgi:hypothetical protein
MRTLLFLIAAPLLAQNKLTPKEIADGWLMLFDGETTWGWTAEGSAKWRVENGVLISDAGEYGWLRSNAPFGDYILRAEYRQAADGNSGIFLRSAATGQPHVTGYELQIYEGHKDYPTGSLLNHGKAEKVKPAPDQWHRYEVTHIGKAFTIKLDGKRVLYGDDDKTLFGHIGLQHNNGKKIEFRNVYIKPLGLTPIFNGRDLSGWRKVERTPAVKEPPVWSVAKKMLHVEKGPGQLETEATYQNFILQIDVRANSKDPAKHPNSGIFFRGTPNGYWTGYEVQVRNEFKGDPTVPVDTGTGGLYFLQPARRVVGRDNEFYTQTILAHGRQISTWVNGYAVTDFNDKNPEGARGPRQKEALLGAGPISLQAHDPTTNLDFRNIRAIALPSK